MWGGGSGSMWKGKERVDVESSLEEGGEDDEDDVDGEKEGSEGEGEGDD